MQKIADKAICSGCHACFNICPKHAITMNADKYGFYYPDIDSEKCIDCGQCTKMCPVINVHDGNKGQAYACINKNEEVRMKSSSGGVFTLIAEYVLKRNGVIFGVVFDDDLNVCHTEITKEEELGKVRGSKYLQSTIGSTYKDAEEYLKDGRTVLFTGTPCQISGLKAFLGKDYPNLIMQDIICHGVPSPQVWQIYLKYKENKHNSELSRKRIPEFRNKKYGWNIWSIKLFFKNGTYIGKRSEDAYARAFLSDICLRPSCYDCKSKSLQRESDITLADFWGIENIMPEMYDNKGTSLIFVNSEKGRKIFEEISEGMVYREFNIDEAVKYNPSAYKSCEKPKNRDKFMKRVNDHNFEEMVRKYSKISSAKRIQNKIKRIVKGVIKYV